MFFRTTLKMAFQNLRVNKMRSFLTMLGIIIGISSVIIILSVGAGAESLIVNQIKSLGSNIIGVLPGASESDGPPAAVFGIVITTLKDSDTTAIAKLPHVAAAASYVSAVETAIWKNQTADISLYGVSSSYPELSDSILAEGFFFTPDDERGLSNVAVIGSAVKDDLFNGNPALGENIRLKKANFRVIGVMAPKGVAGFQNMDNMIFIPVTTAQKKILGIDHIGFLRAKIDDEKNLASAEAEIARIIRERHHIDNPAKDDFTAQSTAAALTTLTAVTGALKLFLVAIAGISLLVGGIGIMNIMLAAVTERIREIGLRKAVGAKKSQIILQFLLETLVITLVGAALGMIVGIFFSWLTAVIVKSLGYNWDFVVTWSSLAVAAGAAVAIGLIFGLYPARKAARLDPITALRYE
jgi:putative ABC transport system permease protein